MYVDLFGHKVELFSRKAKHFLAMQGVYSDLIRLSSDLTYIQEEIKKDSGKEIMEKAVELSQRYEVNSLFYQIVILSDSLKIGRKWWKVWRWNQYRKFEQSYIKNNIDLQTLKDCSEKVGELEGNRKSGEQQGTYIPLDENRVKAFVHKWAGTPYEEVTNQNIIDFFDSIQFAREMLRVQIEGGKINLTKEDEMAFHLEEIKKQKERGWLGKDSKLMGQA